ncbi:MAG: excinuclease ABC subunit C [Bacteroidales bacterium]|nr:excinuclease ABC subunit C [Candidatus Colimorpha onthohippi]
MITSDINPNIDRILLRLKSIPSSPGVYQHVDADGKVIYVGKARNLQKRVSSYFSHYDDKSAKIKMLVRNIYDIRVTVVATEVDALLLENNLIKQYQPRYNSLLKDDKSYPYLLITDEDYPRLLFTRNHTSSTQQALSGVSRRGSGRALSGHYYGPYPNQSVLRALQDIIRQLFQYRTCQMPLSRSGEDKQHQRPCMKYQIGLCKAPCAGLQSYDDYQHTFANIRRILQGDFDDILADLKQQMMIAAQQLRFEDAEALKQKIHLLQEYQSRSMVVNTNVKDVDVYSVLSDDKYAYVNMMRVKNGSIIYSFSTEVRKQLDEGDADILATVIPELHQRTESTALEAVLPIAVPDLPADYLQQTVQPKGDRGKLLELSLRNASSYQAQCRHQRQLTVPSGEDFDLDTQSRTMLSHLQSLLQLPTLPRQIECFDNSNIQGAFPVAAMVRFTDGKPNKAEYRKFQIKTVTGPDDYASMAEVVYRRYSRLVAESKPLPDLLIVDGGEGQMEEARAIIEDQLHLSIPIAGLAKDGRHRTAQLLAFEPNQSGTRPALAVGLKVTDPLFYLLTRIQDEVHRFAISYHRQKRSKGTIKTQLTDIPGIGPKTAQDLLLKFGSVKQISLQTVADLAPLIGPAKAEAVFQYLHQDAM